MSSTRSGAHRSIPRIRILYSLRRHCATALTFWPQMPIENITQGSAWDTVLTVWLFAVLSSSNGPLKARYACTGVAISHQLADLEHCRKYRPERRRHRYLTAGHASQPASRDATGGHNGRSFNLVATSSSSDALEL
jgi:hypothetical protein